MAAIACSFCSQFHWNNASKLLNLSALRKFSPILINHHRYHLSIFSPVFIHKHRHQCHAAAYLNRERAPVLLFSKLSLQKLPNTLPLLLSTDIGSHWLHTSSIDCIKFKSRQSMHNPEEEKRLIKAGYFQSKERNKKTFLMTIDVFKEKEKLLRGHVQFIQTALNHMEIFGVHQDIEVYKKLMDVFPKIKMIPQNMWQQEFDHYPVQQDCGVDLLHRMEHFGVIPDTEMDDMILTIFGGNSHPIKKCRRMRYWMLKFNNASPWPLPKPLPTDLLELAKLAVAKMCSVDQSSEVTVYDTKEVEDAIDDTWVVSGQSIHQRELLAKQPDNVPLKVEGPWKIYLRDQCIDYFVLKADPLPQPEVEEQDKDDVSLLASLLNPDCSLKPNTSVTVRPSVHEQADGTILAICISGTSSRDSLLSWIRLLSRTNPRLEEGLPVIFMQGSPTQDDDLAFPDQDDHQQKKEIEQSGSGQESSGSQDTGTGQGSHGSGHESSGSQDTGGSGQESSGSQDSGIGQKYGAKARLENQECDSVQDGQELNKQKPNDENGGGSDRPVR